MNNLYSLPTSLTIHGKEYELRTDFRAILDILRLSDDTALEEDGESMSPWEKDYFRINVSIRIAFPEWKEIPVEDYEEALTKLYEFIDCGMKEGDKKKPELMNWDKDAPILIPAINSVAGREIRTLPYLHWWTFLGYYLEIGESVFSQVVNIRKKKAEHKKLDEWEKKFYAENKSMIDLSRKQNRRSEQERDELEKIFGITK